MSSSGLVRRRSLPSSSNSFNLLICDLGAIFERGSHKYRETVVLVERHVTEGWRFDSHAECLWTRQRFNVAAQYGG